MASVDLLISQWRGAPNLRALTQIWLDVLDEEVAQPRATLDRMRSLDTAVGVYLDYLGERLGVLRPQVPSTSETLARFDQTGTGFEHGRFAALAQLEALEPLDDDRYRALLMARAEYDERSGSCTLDVMERAVKHIDAQARPSRTTRDMTFTIMTSEDDDMQRADDVGALPRPAGVGLTVSAPAPPHTNWVGIRNGSLAGVRANHFPAALSGTAAALTLPGYAAGQSRRLLFARPATVPDPSEVYLYESGMRNTVNQMHLFTKSATTIELGGEDCNWWGTVDSQSGYGGYVLEQVT